jgi:hypothetical protein
MNIQEFVSWRNDRAASDDEIDELIAVGIIGGDKSESIDEQITALLNRRHGGSRIGRAPNIFRNHGEGHRRIWADYFAPDCVYTDFMFRRRFRMRKNVFWKIHDQIVLDEPYFTQ